MEYHIPDLELLERHWQVRRGSEGEPYFLYRNGWPVRYWITNAEAWEFERQQERGIVYMPKCPGEVVSNA